MWYVLLCIQCHSLVRILFFLKHFSHKKANTVLWRHNAYTITHPWCNKNCHSKKEWSMDNQWNIRLPNFKALVKMGNGLILQINSLSGYRDSHYKDKTVSYLYYANLSTGRIMGIFMLRQPLGFHNDQICARSLHQTRIIRNWALSQPGAASASPCPASCQGYCGA